MTPQPCNKNKNKEYSISEVEDMTEDLWHEDYFVAMTATTSGEELLRHKTQTQMGIPTTPSEPNHLAQFNRKNRLYFVAF